MKELRKAKIEPTPRMATREVRKETKEDRKKKRRRDFSKVHVTNVHLWVRPSQLGCTPGPAGFLFLPARSVIAAVMRC